MHTALLLFGIAACGAGPAPACDTSSEFQARVASAAVAALAGEGFTEGLPGVLKFTAGHAFDNNPAGKYGVYDFLGGSVPAFTLGPSDALLWVGCTPLPAAYFSARSYLFSEPAAGGGGGYDVLFASLGDSTNHLVANTTPGGPWNRTAAFITTADAGTGAAVAAALVAAGLPAGAINVDAIPPGLVAGGMRAALFTYLLRVAVFADPAAGAAYTGATSPVRSLVAAPGRPGRPLPVPALRPRPAVDEAWLAPAQASLLAAAQAHWAAAGGVVSNVQPLAPFIIEGFACIAARTDCLGDNRDAAYMTTQRAETLADDAAVLVIVGVEHGAAGGCAYSAFDVTNNATAAGVAGADSSQFGGSAAYFGPGVPHGDLLFAYAVARNCSAPLAAAAGGYCVQAAGPWLPPDAPIVVWARAYLHRAARVGPATESLLESVVFRVDAQGAGRG